MPALLMPCNVYTHRRGDKQIDASRQQLYGSAFGNNPMRAPDLSGMELHFDRGFSGEKAHSDLYSPTNADSTCTTQRADWAAHNFGQTPKENDKRHYIDPKGIMALYLSEKTINNRKMASGALATGTDNVVLFMSTVHRSLKFDYVTSDRMGDLYTNDRPKLKELGFSLEQTACSSIKSAVAKSIHTEYYKLFQDTPVDQVTAFAGGKEFHLGRKFSLSSKQIYELILVLKKRFKDLDLDYIQEVFNFMYCNYSLEERQAEKDRAEAAAEAVDNEAAEDPITYQSTRTIQELMEADADDRTVEEKVRLHIHMCHESKFIFFCLECGYHIQISFLFRFLSHVFFLPSLSYVIIDLFDASEQDLLAIVMDATTPYLDEFLRQIRGGTASALSAKKNRCKKWIEAPADRRKYVLMKKDKLQEEYTRKHGKPFAASWTPATLIKEILKEAAPEEPSSFEQDVMNAIVGNSVLTKMSDDANESCTKGHEMEPVFAAELMKRAKDGQFPFGTLEEISTVGTVQKTGERHVKTSVDRLLGVKTGDGEESQRELHLLELKARVKAATIQKEQDRVEKLRRKRLLNEDAIFLEMNSDHRHSHLGIASPGERLQALHHAYTYSKTSCIHAVGDTKNIFTVCKMNFSPTLLASYERTIKFIYDSGLNIFYRDEGDEDIQASDEEMARIKKAVKKHKKTYIEYYRFLQAYQVWRELTDCETKLPLPPLKNLLALALSWWNINKPSGDMITQMLWSMMYYSPVSNPQAVLVKRLAHQLPTYMCHRLFQLFNTTRDPSTFKSIYQYRDHTRKKTSLWKSTREIDSILISMANAYNPEPPLPPPPAAAANLAVAGTYTMHGAFQATGQSPLRSRRQWYINSANANLQAFQRRHACLGCSVGIACDQFGRAIAGGNCAQCGGSGATWWCTQCRVFLHGGAPKTSNGEPPLLMAAASHLPPDGRKRTAEGQFVDFFTRMSCSDKWHHCARERAYSGTTATSITTVSTAEFNPSQHNVNSNLSFDDATINTSEEEDATATTSTTIGNNNSNNNNGNNS